jgi:transcriptional regulator with XRE-family HTH domain
MQKSPKVDRAAEVFRRNLKLARLRLGLDQGRAANLCGMYRTHWNEVENGKYYPSFDSIVLMSDALNVPLSKILTPEFTHELEISLKGLGVDY